MTACLLDLKRLFHLRPSKVAYFLAACKPLVIAVLAVALGTAVPAASAGINKCTGTDSKVIFSDQPCTNSQTQTVIKPAQAIRQGGPKEPVDASAARIRTFLSPECVALAEKVSDFFQNGTGQTPEAEVTATVGRYKKLCEPAIGQAVAAEEARKAADNKRVMLENDCKTKKGTVQDAKSRPGGVSDANKPALAAVESSIARDCR